MSGTYYAQRVVDGLEPHDGASIARGLEDEIERRGLQDVYIRALFVQTIPEAARWDITLNAEPGGYIDRASLFLLLRATPEQRARAFLEVAS